MGPTQPPPLRQVGECLERQEVGFQTSVVFRERPSIGGVGGLREDVDSDDEFQLRQTEQRRAVIVDQLNPEALGKAASL